MSSSPDIKEALDTAATDGHNAAKATSLRAIANPSGHDGFPQ
jgi:hypothetical protein